MQNVEFKAELRDVEAARAQCRAAGARRIGQVRQADTYFRMPDGRLKRREAAGEPIEWIFYHRPNGVTPRLSNYTILSDEQARRRWGTQSLRPWLVVRKGRELWMVGNVRIHLDHVDQLGRFIEFEAVVSEDHDVHDCDEQVAELREAFDPWLGEPIGVSYVDLLEQTLAE
ncbi:MAG: class IV adenylate cyclase [Planctomycetota bacterium]|jgi:adenylate cyclase class IV